MRLAHLTALSIPGLLILASCLDTPSAEAVTDPAHKGASCEPPILEALRPPTMTLTTGQVIAYRLKVAAPIQNDIWVKRFTFHVFLSRITLTTRAAEMREVGANAPLDWTVAEMLERGGTPCGFPASAPDRCAVIELEQPFKILAGSKRNLDLRLTISGSMTSGDYLSVMPETEPNQPLASGTLVPGVLGSTVDGLYAPFIWSCDENTWYNDAGIHPPSHVSLNY